MPAPAYRDVPFSRRFYVQDGGAYVLKDVHRLFASVYEGAWYFKACFVRLWLLPDAKQ